MGTRDDDIPRDLSTFGGRLRARRIDLGMTQQQLQALSGVEQGRISEYERGETKSPSIANVAALARALRVSAEYLADGDESANALIQARYLTPGQQALIISMIRQCETANEAAGATSTSPPSTALPEATGAPSHAQETPRARRKRARG